MLDMESFTKLLDILIFKRSFIICDNGARDVIPTDEVIQDEGSNLFASHCSQWNYFDPFGEVLSGNDDEISPI